MATEAMVTEASVVVTGALVVDTEVEDIPQVATGTTGDRVDMVTALDPIAMAMTAMRHTSKPLPDSRSSLGWPYLKAVLLKEKNMSTCNM
ncbi:hypothetical protein WJF86_24105 [Salmonella enterica subsp. enterica serovar Corvallis]